MEIPLILKLKKKIHKDIAEAQDLIVRELYNFFEKAVLHGGTSIWRCYDGNRFSEDIDVYLESKEKIKDFFEALRKKDFIILKKKISERSLFSVLEFNNVVVRLEAIFKKPKKITLKEYKTSDGNFITVYTLTPEDIIKEKIEAYSKRLKIRDLYDIFFLLRYVKNKNEIVNDLEKLVKRFKNPTDEKELKVLIIEGIVPNINEILNYIKRYVGK